jgi:carbon-monoxide dehydrogenase large subunit
MEAESRLNPLGVKGIGEAGTIPVAAVIANAVQDALGPDVALITEAPLTPVRVVAALDSGPTRPGGDTFGRSTTHPHLDHHPQELP